MEVKEKLIEKYGKYIIWALLAFGGPMLTTYINFVNMAEDIHEMKQNEKERREELKQQLLQKEQELKENLEEKLEIRVEQIKDHEQRLRRLEWKE